MLRAALLALVVALPAQAVETMRISMGPPVASAEIRGVQLAWGPDSETGQVTPARRSAVTVEARQGRLWLDGAPVVGKAIRFRAGDDAADAGVVGTAPISAGGMEVRGDVVAWLDGRRLRLINVLPLEEYLAAVLGGEMPASFPLEALKAQAVAARTYAIERKLSSLGEPYFLKSSVLAQVYKGISREDARTRKAVAETRGEILTYELQPIEAYFHASCGGRTESGKEALGRDLPYLQSVDCPCGKLPQSRWSLRLPTDELDEVLGGRASSLAVVSRTRTGRAREIRVGRRTMDAVSFRARIGYDKVKSLSFKIEPEAGGYLLEGKGYGHGAGLCQWGAKVYADEGKGFRWILSHYYPGAELQRLY